MRNFTPQGPSGRQLPAQWARQAEENRLNFDAILRDRLENAWREPLRGSQGAITARDARLGHNDRSDSKQGGQEARMDGKMKMVGRQDEWEIWRDSVSGATVGKRTKQ